MSVSALARRSGLSRRYLTEAEAGRANPSILVLGQLATALDYSLASMVANMRWRSPAHERFALVGLRGAGKSTIGKMLAAELDALFFELDSRVEDLAEQSLVEIFKLHGVDGFHRLEAEALERVLKEGDRVVVAAGGSIVEEEANFERLRATCRTVWLRATTEDHFDRVLAQGDRRPTKNRPRAMEELEAILAGRRAQYSRCEFTVDTSGRTPVEVVSEILQLAEV